MRRNIQGLLTDDQLRVDTLRARRIEEDRLQRLQDNIEHPQCHLAIHTPPLIDKRDPLKLLSIQHKDSVPVTMVTGRMEHNKQTAIIRTDQDTDSDDDDDDDETLLRKRQRLHVDDRVNRPDEHGNRSLR